MDSHSCENANCLSFRTRHQQQKPRFLLLLHLLDHVSLTPQKVSLVRIYNMLCNMRTPHHHSRRNRSRSKLPLERLTSHLNPQKRPRAQMSTSFLPRSKAKHTSTASTRQIRATHCQKNNAPTTNARFYLHKLCPKHISSFTIPNKLPIHSLCRSTSNINTHIHRTYPPSSPLASLYNSPPHTLHAHP